MIENIKFVSRIINDGFRVMFICTLSFIAIGFISGLIYVLLGRPIPVDLLSTLALAPITYVLIMLAITMGGALIVTRKQWEIGHGVTQPYFADNGSIVSHPDHCVYLVKRQDGIFKIGKTINFDQRIADLEIEYGPLDTVALWQVRNIDDAENLALAMTGGYRHKEAGRMELRKMSSKQARWFVDSFSKSEAVRRTKFREPKLY